MSNTLRDKIVSKLQNKINYLTTRIESLGVADVSLKETHLLGLRAGLEQAKDVVIKEFNNTLTY